MTLSPREAGLLSNTDVLGYVRAQNAELNAQAKAEGWSFWTTMPECEDFLAEYANVYELELSFARGTYADVHKDAWGFKGYVSDELTLEQVEAEIEELSEMAAEGTGQSRSGSLSRSRWSVIRSRWVSLTPCRAAKR